MAINISYDPSDDPEALAAREAEEQDSLEVGEKMLEDQADLLAGKYRNAEELEKAYVELQQRLGRGDEDDDSGEISSYQIVGDYESDIKNKKLSVSSPLARGLINKSVDDVVEINSPKGQKSYTIKSVEYI